MAQFDVHRLANGAGLVVDCQSDLLSRIESRFVVPLVPRSDVPVPARRLNPVFAIGGAEYVLLAQSAAAIRRRDLGPVTGSLDEHRLQIVGALDVLIGGV